VTWDAPAADARTRALLRLSIDQHGTTPVTLVCDFADTGVGEIPQTVIDELVAAGISGFPNGTLTRRTVDRQEVSDGCMEFQVALPVQQDVRVSGHIPCNVPMDCPLGQTCDLPTQTCI
jgi:hypothetical protein